MANETENPAQWYNEEFGRKRWQRELEQARSVRNVNYRRVHCILLHFSKWRNHHKTQQRAHTKNTENLLKKLKKKRRRECAQIWKRRIWNTRNGITEPNAMSTSWRAKDKGKPKTNRYFNKRTWIICNAHSLLITCYVYNACLVAFQVLLKSNIAQCSAWNGEFN